MKIAFGMLAVAGLAAAASADIVLDAHQTGQYTIGQAGVSPAAVPNSIYSNVDVFTGLVILNGGATAGITRLVADDCTMIAHTPGDITQFNFNVANLNTVAVSARARVRFYQDNGSGAPGTVIAGFSFNPISFAANSVGTYFTTLALGTLADFTGTIWAGMTYDNVGATTTTNAQLNNLGMGIFAGPDQGSSTNIAFRTTAAGSFLANSPAGGNLTPGATEPAYNLGWAFVPSPSSLALLGLGGLAAARRRR